MEERQRSNTERSDSPIAKFNEHIRLSRERSNSGGQSQNRESPTKMMNEHMRKTSQCTVKTWSTELVKIWLEDGQDSLEAFEALIHLLQATLDPSQDFFYVTFEGLLGSFPNEDQSVDFLQKALSRLIDSDLLSHTDYVDLLLLYLSMHQINYGQNVLQKFVQETPYFDGFYLRKHGKRFQEMYEHIWDTQERSYDEKTKTVHVTITPHYLACMHIPSRKVIVSNAPPVKLKRRRLLAANKFECEVSAGGLVSGIRPSLDQKDVWVSYLEAKLLDLDRMPTNVVPKIIRDGVRVAPTFRRSTSVLRYSFEEANPVESEAENFYQECLYERAENDFLSLQRRLEKFAEKNFVVNPLIIMKEDHKGFYDGISNGLFWPAFHNLPEYIIEEYRSILGKEQLAVDWQKYIKVNFHFAIHAARSCRMQDFLWIHDYHLFLVGDILRSLDPNLDCGFFLHIPFRLTEQFISEFPEQGKAVLKALMGFTRVGFQSNKDTLNFVRLIRLYYPDAHIQNRAQSDGESLIFVINLKDHWTSVGTFPISISTDKILSMNQEANPESVADMKANIMRGRKGKLFLSVERFDYTKGIIERLDGILRYFENHPERATQDVFYQVAAASRTEISSYREYQRKVIDKIQLINERYSPDPDSPVFIVDRTNRPQEDVVELYQAADVIVVTPLADGMNLVIKEGILSNPNAVLLLSTGAGAENQLFDAGLGDCYLRLEKPSDTEEFANLFYRATNVPADIAAKSGEKLYEYTVRHDIEYWITTFTTPVWTHYINPMRPITSYEELRDTMEELHRLRCHIARLFSIDAHVGRKASTSFDNILKSIQEASFPSSEKPDMTYVIKDIEQDTKMLSMIYGKNKSVQEWVEALSCMGCTKVDDIKDATVITLKSVIDSPIDLVIVRYDDIVCGTKYPIPHDLKHQSLTSGFLIHLFLSRYATHVVFLSHHPLQFATKQNSFPLDIGIYCAPDGCKVENDLILSYDKKQTDLRSRLEFCLNKGRVNLGTNMRVSVLSAQKGNKDDVAVVDWLKKEGCDVRLVDLNLTVTGGFCQMYATMIPFILRQVVTER